MGKLKNFKIVIVIICLLLTSSVMFWHGTKAGKQLEKTASLSDTLTRIGPWNVAGEFPLPQNVVTALKLDDFINRNYSNGHAVLSLYIGYYNSSKKVGAAHDPTVCFPGQGWVLKEMRKGVLPAEIDNQKAQIHYSSMIAERNGKRELLLYWFQAYDQATSDTLSQKISLLRSKILGGGEDNAFVRISINLDKWDKDEGLALLKDFAQDLFPVFTGYILSSVPQEAKR